MFLYFPNKAFFHLSSNWEKLRYHYRICSNLADCSILYNTIKRTISGYLVQIQKPAVEAMASKESSRQNQDRYRPRIGVGGRTNSILSNSKFMMRFKCYLTFYLSPLDPHCRAPSLYLVPRESLLVLSTRYGSPVYTGAVGRFQVSHLDRVSPPLSGNE